MPASAVRWGPMRKWELTLALDSNSGLPLFLQLSKAVADGIRTGRLKPGDALPGTRALAARLGVHRNTVIAGYEELTSEGLVTARWGGGTFVAEPPPRSLAATPAPAPAPSYTVAPPIPMPPSARVPPGMLMMFRGVPDVRLLPAQTLARAFRRAVSSQGRTILSYGDPRGHARLRSELAIMLRRTRGLAATAENVMVTRGSQQAIDLVARTLIAPGDVVAVEVLGDPSTRNALRLAGAELEPVPIDDEGLDVEALASLMERRRLRAICVTPHHQFPTTVVMSPARRARLARLAFKHRAVILEDDYDHEFHYEGKPVLPMAAGPGRANVIYVGSLSKVFAPGLRTGFIVAPEPVLERLISVRVATDLQGDAAVECAVAELMEDGEFFRHVRRMRKIYAHRRDALADALARHLGGALSFRVPDGGMAIWARVDDAIDVPAWVRASELQGVLFCGARVHDFFARELPFVRLGFTYHDEAELADAARRMARALKPLRRA
jgi:GntR family transcriptional regulator/MocR family aminotransferase